MSPSSIVVLLLLLRMRKPHKERLLVLLMLMVLLLLLLPGLHESGVMLLWMKLEHPTVAKEAVLHALLLLAHAAHSHPHASSAEGDWSSENVVHGTERVAAGLARGRFDGSGGGVRGCCVRVVTQIERLTAKRVIGLMMMMVKLLGRLTMQVRVEHVLLLRRQATGMHVLRVGLCLLLSSSERQEML